MSKTAIKNIHNGGYFDYEINLMPPAQKKTRKGNITIVRSEISKFKACLSDSIILALQAKLNSS